MSTGFVGVPLYLVYLAVKPTILKFPSNSAEGAGPRLVPAFSYRDERLTVDGREEEEEEQDQRARSGRRYDCLELVSP